MKCEIHYNMAVSSRLKVDGWRNRARDPNARAKHVSPRCEVMSAEGWATGPTAAPFPDIHISP